TRGEGWEVVNTDTQELVTQAPVANYFEAEEQAMRLNEALPEPTRQLQGGYLPGQRVRDRRGRVLTVIDNAGPNLLMAQAADGSRVRVHLRAIEPVDEPIRPPVEPDVIEVEAEPVEATPPPAPTPPAQQVAPPSPPAEPVPPPTPPSESEPVRQPIDLNQSDLAALSQIPGIGRTMAQRIIELRERLGGFTSVEQLRQVQGIGPARFNFISRYV